MIDELWRPVAGYEESLEVSTLGNIRRNGKPSKQTRRTNGYLVVGVWRKGSRVTRTRFVHELVLTAFVGPRPPRADARHLNGRRDDNRLENLVWGSRSENEMDKFAHGTKRRGLQHEMSIGEGCFERAMDLMRNGTSQRETARWLGISRNILRKHISRCEPA